MGNKINPSIKVGFSEKKNETSAVEEVYSQIKQDNTKLIIYFVPAPYDQQVINDEFRKKIPIKIPFIGCSSVYIPTLKVIDNITPRGLKEAIVAMSIASDDIRASVRLMKNIKENWKEESKKALIEASKDLGIDPKNTDPQRYFGILLCDAMAEREEYILENLYARSNFLFIGGGSCGKHSLLTGVKPGFIHTREGVFNNAAAIAVVNSDIPFKIDMTTSVVPTNIKVKITKAKDRKVYEINGKPAAKEYARLLGKPKFMLGTKRIPNYWLFVDHPIGNIIKDRAIIKNITARDGNYLLVGCNIKKGEELYLMIRRDMMKSLDDLINRIKSNLKSVEGILFFQCASWFFDAYREKKAKELFKKINVAPVIGLNSYGEYYGWVHISRSLTAIAFGKKEINL